MTTGFIIVDRLIALTNDDHIQWRLEGNYYTYRNDYVVISFITNDKEQLIFSTGIDMSMVDTKFTLPPDQIKSLYRCILAQISKEQDKLTGKSIKIANGILDRIEGKTNESFDSVSSQ